MKYDELKDIMENAKKELEIRQQQEIELMNDLTLKRAEIYSTRAFIKEIDASLEVPKQIEKEY